MTAWLVYSVITGAFLAVAAMAAEGLLKSARRPVRAVWFAAIALTIAFTFSAPLRSKPPVAIVTTQYVTVQQAPVVDVLEPTFFESLEAFGTDVVQTVMRPLNRATELASSASASVNRTVRMLALASAALALIVLLTVYARSMRERITWPRMLLLGKNVRVAPNVGPAVLGLAPPEIVVPRWVLLRKVEEQRLVLEHESEHIRANDPLLLMFACIAVACMPWNAALWFMWSRLRLAVELDCDRRVLLRGVQKPAYGQLLVELSSNRPWMSPAIPAFSWGTSHLEQRLVAMTARPQRFRPLRRVASGAVIATALLAATKAEMPAPDVLQAMEASHLSQGPNEATRYFREDETSSTNSTESSQPTKMRGTLDLAPLHAPNAASQDTIPRKKVAPRVVVKKPIPRKKVIADSVSKVAYKVVPTDSVRRVAHKGRPATVVDSIPYVKRIRLASDSINTVQKIQSGRITTEQEPVRYVYGKNLIVKDSLTGMVLTADTLVLQDSIVTMQGSGSRIRIRGASSAVPIDNSPLILLNGVVFAGSLNAIDPQTIDRVEVIKGPSAVALYGALAANGVISITTKR